MNFHDALKWRYATKKMTGETVPQEKVDRILEAIRMAPTSMGFQPFTVFTITDPEIKEQILPIANGQTQVRDGSHLLIFAAWTEITEERIEDYMNLTAEERKLSLQELQPLRNMLNGAASQSPEKMFEWSARQAYIAFGFGMAAAAVEEVDATPMEGFNPEALDELLDLPSKGLRSVLMLPLGYRDEENDWLAPMKKVRRPKDEFFQEAKVAEMA
ncbi:nitroreductase family protein [Gracilimonas mengyeensis]|uniref:Nitroreductase n=1 Tax=Gracilimonas mengyeensis TaxID=1302730 RepID=A0A521EI14_9BACT|nr:nitroreductase family protein [Gracilimonas mengyeensis]SMO83535.1 Nitroreductase [Gracilimonas mengyeensis]